MMSQEDRTVAIVGCGVIGMGWAALFLSRGLKAIISDPAEWAEDTLKRYLEQAKPFIEEHGTFEQHVTNYEFVRGHRAENGPERQGFKKGLLKTLDEHARPGVVIASSSSCLPSSAFIQQCEKDLSRVLIGHPFSPPHSIPLVEAVRNFGTSD
ncbi:uncharacterized protein PG986_008704 [Apiospora aurea]|uniref:3-hydroxyacyl-CoA dehydrogenase NAD binding domain-containing protein n=1 Tax=Apiospora aurea TaxID=335848 RepID=A0ABR1Q5S9_9PEZI